MPKLEGTFEWNILGAPPKLYFWISNLTDNFKNLRLWKFGISDDQSKVPTDGGFDEKHDVEKWKSTVNEVSVASRFGLAVRR